MQKTNHIVPGDCHSIEEIRSQIDEIDRQLVDLFARRFEFVREIVKYKEKNVDAIVAQERKNLVISQRSEWAKELGLDQQFFADLFSSLISHNISKELEIMNRNK